MRVLSRVTAAPHKSAHDEVDKLFSDLSIESPKNEVIVAVRKDSILATAFHPELTNDLRWHRYGDQYVLLIHKIYFHLLPFIFRYFLGMVKEYQSMNS